MHFIERRFVMKKLLIGLFLLLWALAACTAAGDVPEAENTETATPEEAAVTEVEATATTETKPTETPTPTDEPEPTTEPTSEPTAEATVTKAPAGDGYPPPPVELAEGVVIVFTQTGGFVGLDDTWTIYSDGRVTKNGGAAGQFSQDEMNDLLNTLEELNFFETSYQTTETICCDFFHYTLAVESGDKRNFVSFSEGDENVPQNLREAVMAVQAALMSAQEM